MTRLLDALPPDLHRYIALDATTLLTLPATEQERLRHEVQRYFAAHPDDQALLIAASPGQQTTLEDT